MLTQELLKSILHYDKEMGIWTWKVRTPDMFTIRGQRWTQEVACDVWNKKFAGKTAGSKYDGYIWISIDDERYSAHRLAMLYMTGEMPAFVDHEDLDRSNNKWSNLRVATMSQNQWNRGLDKRNKSGMKGVSFMQKRKTWRAAIGHNGKVKNLGNYDCPAAAHLAYVVAASTLRGEFARTR